MYRIAGNFRKVKFSKNLISKKYFLKILLLSQLSSCVAIEIRKNIFENDWLFSKIKPSKISRYTVPIYIATFIAQYNIIRLTIYCNTIATYVYCLKSYKITHYTVHGDHNCEVAYETSTCVRCT